MMAANKRQKMQNGSTKENVLQRVLQLPVVNATCESLQRTYTSTKEVHPLVASLCEAYERGVKGASSLAAWSMEPVVRRLEPQFTAVNILACRGLDHLEEKIPALQYPVEKIASELKGSISTPIQSARSTIGNSIAGTLDRVLGLTAEGYELTKSTVRGTAEYTWSNRVSQMAAAGVDGALGQLEKLVEFLLPEEAHEPDTVNGPVILPVQGAPHDGPFQQRYNLPPATNQFSEHQLLSFPQGGAVTLVRCLLQMEPERRENGADYSSARLVSCPFPVGSASLPVAHEPTSVHGSEVTPSQPQPGTFTRIGALASTISHRAYQQTARTIQRTRARGQELTTWIPGLGALARQSTAKAQQVLYDVQNAAAGWLSNEQSKEPEQEQEKEELKKEETKASEMAEGAKTPGLLGSMAQRLQTAYLSTISNVKRVPSAAWGTAGELLQLTPRKAASIAREKVGTLGDALRSVTGSMVETLSHYVPLPRLLAKKEEQAHEKEPPPEPQRGQKGSRPVAPPYPEKSQLRGDWRANRAHHPLSFLGLEDPFFLQPSSIQRQAPQRSPTFEPDYPTSRKSAFSPYREGLSTRRVSKNSYRYSPEPVYTRANYSNLYTMAFKKD